MDRFLDQMLEENNIRVAKTEEMYLKIKDEESLDPFIKELQALEKDLPLGEELDEYWTLIEVASAYGKNITEDYSRQVFEDINCFISEFFYYKGYIFGVMHGQGSCAWYAPWEDYSSVLGKEQLSLNF